MLQKLEKKIPQMVKLQNLVAVIEREKNLQIVKLQNLAAEIKKKS